jgi:hypothetical protein
VRRPVPPFDREVRISLALMATNREALCELMSEPADVRVAAPTIDRIELEERRTVVAFAITTDGVKISPSPCGVPSSALGLALCS